LLAKTICCTDLLALKPSKDEKLTPPLPPPAITATMSPAGPMTPIASLKPLGRNNNVYVQLHQSALHPCAVEFLSLLPKFRLHKLRQEPTQQQHKKEPQTLKTLIFYKSSRPQHRIFTFNHIT
jgi:hypothetical protein